MIEIKHTLGSSVDKLASVHSFDGDEVLNSLLVSVCVPESHFSEWSTSTWVMHDVLHNSLDVSRPIIRRVWILTPVSQRSQEF